MSELRLPKAWEALVEKQDFLPVIVKSIENAHDTNWSMEPNRHKHFEMVYIKKGNSVFKISDTSVEMEPNDIVIIKPNQYHKLSVKSSAGCEFIVLHFKFKENTGKSFSNVSINDFIEFVNDDQKPFIHLKLSRKNDIVNVMNRIIRERSKQLIWGDYLSYLLIMELFVLISRTLKLEWEQNIKNRSSKLKELLYAAKEYIDVNYSKDLSLSDIAKYIFLSESYFAHTFKDQFKTSPKKYLLKVRIDASKDLLANTDMKINNIALTVGFSSQQRYNDMFRKYVHQTPLRYRKQERLKLINKEG